MAERYIQLEFPEPMNSGVRGSTVEQPRLPISKRWSRIEDMVTSSISITAGFALLAMARWLPREQLPHPENLDYLGNILLLAGFVGLGVDSYHRFNRTS